MLMVNEIFYSYQGEGKTVGVPSIFVRLQGCNLRCSFCDTLYAVDKNPNVMSITVDQLVQKVSQLSSQFNVHHVVITGGEPLLQAQKVLEFIKQLSSISEFYSFEIETNGTIIPDVGFKQYDVHFNVSYKTKEDIDITFDVFEVFDSIYKIVVNPFTKLNYEILDKIVVALRGRNMHKLYLMPECKTKEEYDNVANVVFRLANSFNANFSTRFHILTDIK